VNIDEVYRDTLSGEIRKQNNAVSHAGAAFDVESPIPPFRETHRENFPCDIISRERERERERGRGEGDRQSASRKIFSKFYMKLCEAK